VPEMGESVSQAVLLKWHKTDGQTVSEAEPIAELETEKANVDLPSPAAGVLHPLKKEGDKVQVGETIATIDEASPKTKAPAASAPASAASPAAPPPQKAEAPAPPPAKKTEPAPPPKAPKKQEEKPARPASAVDGIRREPMSKIRKTIAQRLVEAQHTAAILHTYNEADLQAIQEIRAREREQFEKTHGVSLGLMSFFCRASILALREFPAVNAFVEGDQIVYHDYVNLGIAVSTERGLVVPVLKHAEEMSFAKIETEIKRLAASAREGKLALEDLSGGTFTITNGGVFGSLLSAPILNPPQSAILGMHAIQKRPVVIDDQIVIRPMMYLVLGYDHRLIDGRESVSFLVRVKQYLEDPARLMLEI
jgi:2-oxoglutarate dehydrogenase E2 component (dihydrolipoamide succinyltransferase)